MINELINLTKKIFPSIDPYTAESAKKAIERYKTKQSKINWFLNNSLNDTAQGDIVENVPFVFYDSNGTLMLSRLPGIIISNTCDITRNESIVIAPLIEITNENVRNQDIMNSYKNNIAFNCMNMPNSEYENYIINFDYIQNLKRNLFEQGLKDNKIKRVKSLSGIGYYIFLIKLTIYFMRPEDTGIQFERKSEKE